MASPPADKTRETTEFALLPRFGYVFAQQGHVLPGSFEIVVEQTFLTVFQHQTVYVGGLAALLKYTPSPPDRSWGSNGASSTSPTRTSRRRTRAST